MKSTATMLCVLNILVNSLIMSPTSAKSHVDGNQCIWKVSVISSTDLDVREVPFQNNRDLLSLEKTLENLQLNTMSLEQQTHYYSYPYFLHLNILCNEKISSQMSHMLVAIGVHPEVTITHQPLHIDGCYDGGKTKYTMTGALVDLVKDEDIPNECDGISSCHLSWVIPLVMDKCSVIIQVDVDSGSVYRLVLPTRHFINSNGYDIVTTENDNAAIFQNILGAHTELEDLVNVSDISSYKISHIPSATPTMIIGGIGQTNNVIMSTTEFEDYQVIQVTLPSPSITCQETSQHISQAASLPDRILFSTSAGLFEAFGLYGFLEDSSDSIHQTLTPVLSDYCVVEVVLTTHTYTEHVSVLALGSQDDRQVVLTGRVQTGIPLQLVEVVDENHGSVCDKITHQESTCNIVTGAMGGIHKGTFILLLLVNDTAQMPIYYIMQGIEDEFSRFHTWVQLASFPAMQIPNTDSGHHYPIKLGPPEQTPRVQSGNLTITGVTFIGLVSQHLFLWGNFLLHSPDGGVSVFLLPQYTSSSTITSLSVSHTNTFAFINDQQELWYGIIGDTVTLHRLRPSAGWTLQFSTQGFKQSEEDESLEEHILTLFYDQNNQLFELVASSNESSNKMDVFRRAVPISEVVSYDNYISTYNGATTGVRDKQISTCPFVNLFFEADIHQYTERIQHFIFSKPHLTDPKQLHTVTSLMVYQGIVHEAILQSSKDKPKGVTSLYDPIVRWKASMSVLRDYYEWLYKTNRVKSKIHVPMEEFGKLYEGIGYVDRDLPSVMYLDLSSPYNFSVYLSLDLPEMHVAPLDSLWLAVEVSDVSLIEVLVTRVVNYLTNHVIYQVSVQDKGKLGRQSPPGLRLHPASVLFQIWNSAFKCTQTTLDSKNRLLGSYGMNVLLGCAPGTRLIFDLKSTLEYAKTEFGIIYDCPVIRANPDMPCFYYKQAFYPFFQVLDLVTGKAHLFTGNYTFSVIGGTHQDISDVKNYTLEKQQLYNLQKHANDETLIWIPIEGEISQTKDSSVIFNHEHNGILWRCQQNSACSDVPLKFPYAPEYYFLIEVSNMNVDASRTYCDYTLQFVIRVHGFPISPMRSIRIVLWTFFIFCMSLAIFVVWNHNKQHPFVMPAFLKQPRKPKIVPKQDAGGDTPRYRRGRKGYQTGAAHPDIVSAASSERVLDVYSMESAVFRRVKREQESNYSMTEGSSSDYKLPSGDPVPVKPSVAASPIPEEPSQEFEL